MVDAFDADDLFAVFDDTLAEDEDPGYEEPEVLGGPAVFLRKLREHAPTWRELGVTLDDTWTGYGNGRLWVAIELHDRHRTTTVGAIRVDFTETEWVAGWVSPELATQSAFDNTSPTQRTGGTAADPAAAATAAVAWLETQLRTPIVVQVRP